MAPALIQYHTISIHAPREGGDGAVPANSDAFGAISIHAPREGGDLASQPHGA